MKTKKSALKRVAVTTGDIDGIGYEVSAKALAKLGPQKGCHFFVFVSPRSEFRHRDLLRKKFSIVTFTDLAAALRFSNSNTNTGYLIEILSNNSPALWVETAAKNCLNKNFHSLVTAPLSKQEIKLAGFSDLGHTDILKRLSKKKNAFMTFVGDRFNVLLVSGHQPVKQVESKLSRSLIREALENALSARSFLPKSQQEKPLAVLGLNPHAGDQGMIGQFDGKTLKPLLKTYSSSKVVGPLVPDVAYLPENWSKYSFYIAQYHDQGLIPFKMIHGFDSGVHLTLGLPLRRTSVDHGTAKDIFGKNRANPHSMIEALRWGVRLAQK